jgi:hypothetical protein
MKSDTPRTDAIHSEKDKEFRDNLTQYRFMHDHAETLEKELTAVTEQRDRLAEAVNAATILIAAKGRHNTMLAYNGLRDALQSLTTNAESIHPESKPNDHE